MELADAVADLVRIHGSTLFADPRSFRGALDDYLDEETAPAGTVKLLTDAVELGALDSLVMMLDQGADPRSAVEMVGDRLARDRGSADLAGSRWACAVLGYAVGRVPADVEADLRNQVVLPTSTIPTPTTQRLSTTEPPGDGRTRVIHEEPAPDGGRDRRRPWALIVGGAAVAGILAAVVLAIVVLDDDEGSPGGGGDDTTSEDELARREVTTESSGIEATFRIMLDGTDAYLVMDLGSGDDLEETARVELSCPFVEGSMEVILDVSQGVPGLGPDEGDGLVGWDGPVADTAYAEYFQWNAAQGMVELLGVQEGQECPAAP